jgi:hypothetical protein
LVQTDVSLSRSQYPGSLHFDYGWDQKKGKALGLQQVWRDDKFTYLRGQFQETPALYELKDKKGSLINFDYSAGLYTVPKQLDATAPATFFNTPPAARPRVSSAAASRLSNPSAPAQIPSPFRWQAVQASPTTRAG